jgi:hypothetical protein
LRRGAVRSARVELAVEDPTAHGARDESNFDRIMFAV